MSYPDLGGGDTRIRIASTGSFVNPQIGDVWTIKLARNIQAGEVIMQQDRGAGPVTLSLTGMSHTVDANDKPAIGGSWPLVATANNLSLQSTPINVTNPATAPGAPTIGTLSQVGGTGASQAGTAPANNGGSAITQYIATVYDGDNDAFIGTFTSASLPIAINGMNQGRRIYSKLQAVNNIGTSVQSAASNTITVGVVDVAQGASPYTIQANDNGKRIVPAATSAEFFINVPTGLGAAFSCTIAPTGSYPVQIQESGAAVSNSGYRISNVNLMANSVLLPGRSATLAASSADVLALTGSVMQYQQVIDGTGLNDANTGAAAQITSYYKARAKGALGNNLVGLKFLYAHRFSNVETVPAYSADVGFSVEYPIGSTPQLCKWAGVDQITVTGNETDGGVTSDYLLLATPIPLTPSGTEVGIHSGQRTGSSATPCLSGKGSGRVLTGEVFLAGGTDGTQWKTNLSVFGSTLSDQAQSRTSLASPAIFRPSAIIGVTDTGAEVLLIDSRCQPSNGDRQTESSGYKGELERIRGDEAITLNLGISASQITFFNNATQGKWRRFLCRFGRTLFLNGIYNDANKPLTTIKTSLLTMKGQLECVGKKLKVRTTSPGTASTDKHATLAGQSALVLANSQNIDQFNIDLVARTISGVDEVIDARPYVEGGTLSDGTRGWRVAPNGRTVTDGVMANGSDLLTSVTANFSAADTGRYIFVSGLQVSGQTVGGAVMTYDSGAGGVRLKSVESEQQIVAQAALTGQTCNIQCQDGAFDGIHASIRQGQYEQANRAFMQPQP